MKSSMSHRRVAFAAVVLLVAAGPVSGQETGAPVFWAPFRTFEAHELGGTISFPSAFDGGTAFEAFYGFGSGNLDIGLRGGFWSPGEASDTRILVGVHARQRVITHSGNFPVDGAAVLGIGAQLVSGSSQLLIPGGLSLGRRLVLEDSEVSILPYVQPTLFLAFNDGTDVLFAFGLGGDFRLSRVLEARISVGLGDVDGVALSAVWVH